MPAASQRPPFAGQDVAAVLEELARGCVEREHDLLARPVARRLDRANQEGERLVGALQVGCEAALVADIGVVAGVLQRLLQAVEDLGAPCAGCPRTSRRPTGMTMNSCTSIGLSACAPPLMTFIIGTGSTQAHAADIAPERQAQAAAAALAHGQLTPRIALAPSRPLLPCRRARSGCGRCRSGRARPGRAARRRSRR